MLLDDWDDRVLYSLNSLVAGFVTFHNKRVNINKE